MATATSKLSIIRNADQINRGLTSLKKQGESYHKALHVMAVSVLVHAAEHGQVAPLNRFFNLLTTNYQTAFKLYVRRFQVRVTDEGDHVPTDKAFLKFEKNEFRIDTSLPKANRKTFCTFAEKSLINPDMKNVMRFFDRNNISEVKKFGDDNVLKTLEGMLKSAAGEKEKTKSSVSDPMLKVIKEATEKAAAIREQAAA